MELRNLGRSGLKVSSVGLGGNTFGRTADDAESVRIVRRAIELGVTFIDTADVYAEGRSEQLVGQAVADRRQEVVIATKCGLAMPGGPKQRGLSRRWIRQAIEDSLRRLGMDYVDLYQAHFPDDETPLEETLRAMDDLVRQGKTRHIGCSNYTASDLGRALGISERLGLAPWVSAQNRWNLLDGLEDPLLPSTCRELGVGIIPYQPLASGILTGKYTSGKVPPPGSRAADNPGVRRRLTDPKIAAVERLRPWAEQRGHSTTELAVAWLLAHPEVSTVIVGARSTAQVEENVRAVEWRLSAAERDEAAELAAGGAEPH